jgi:hypothetical protein
MGGGGNCYTCLEHIGGHFTHWAGREILIVQRDLRYGDFGTHRKMKTESCNDVIHVTT